jgi:hypothetical protein
MKRRGTLTVLLLAVAVALVAVFAGTGSADHPGSRTLTFVERNNEGTFRFIDVRPKARPGSESTSAGDMFLGSNRLYNAANERRRGRLFFKCTAVVARRDGNSPFLCEGTARLRRGTLVISALLQGEDDPAGATTGGTGAYEGASGSFTSDERKRISVDTFHFDTD